MHDAISGPYPPKKKNLRSPHAHVARQPDRSSLAPEAYPSWSHMGTLDSSAPQESNGAPAGNGGARKPGEMPQEKAAVDGRDGVANDAMAGPDVIQERWIQILSDMKPEEHNIPKKLVALSRPAVLMEASMNKFLQASSSEGLGHCLAAWGKCHKAAVSMMTGAKEASQALSKHVSPEQNSHCTTTKGNHGKVRVYTDFDAVPRTGGLSAWAGSGELDDDGGRRRAQGLGSIDHYVHGGGGGRPPPKTEEKEDSPIHEQNSHCTTTVTHAGYLEKWGTRPRGEEAPAAMLIRPMEDPHSLLCGALHGEGPWQSSLVPRSAAGPLPGTSTSQRLRAHRSNHDGQEEDHRGQDDTVVEEEPTAHDGMATSSCSQDDRVGTEIGKAGALHEEGPWQSAPDRQEAGGCCRQEEVGARTDCRIEEPCSSCCECRARAEGEETHLAPFAVEGGRRQEVRRIGASLGDFR